MTFKKLGPALFDLGYQVLPAKGKRIVVDDWTTIEITNEKVRYWANNGQAEANVGIRTGVGEIAIYAADNDTTDPALAKKVRESFVAHFGEGVLRLGRKPKSLMIYRGTAGCSKIASPKWVSPDGRYECRFEMLGDGQQFIAAGTHPDTGRPYEYPMGDGDGLLSVESYELPRLDVAGVRDWVRDVLPGLIPEDWTLANDGGFGGGGGDRPAASDDVLDNIAPRLDIEEEVIERVLTVLDPDMTHDDWVKVLMGLHHQYGGDESGRALAEAWSRRGSKFDERVFSAKWRSFDEDVGRRSVTFATALKMAHESPRWVEIEKEKKAEVLNGWMAKVEACSDAHDLQKLAEKEIAYASDIGDMDRVMLIDAMQRRAKDITGVRPTKDVVMRWVKPRANNPMPDLSSEGYPLETAKNMATLCDNLGVVIRYNVVTKNDEILIPDAKWSDDNRDNAALAWLVDALHRAEVRSTHVKDFVTLLADNNPFNPVMTWIESKPWDGVSRLDEFYATVTERKGEIATSLKNVLMLRWLVSAVKAASDPNGIAAQGVLVFQGDQYAGKTRWLKSLAPTAFKFIYEGLTLDPKSKDSVMIAISHWLVELGELDATFKKAEISALKAFITQPFDILRKAYARTESKFPRRTVFAASVNDDKFLQDPTGNRRFWVIPVEKIDHTHGIDMQQLWAEVYELLKKGEKHYLSPEEMAALNEHNIQFTASSPIAELVTTRLDWENFTLDNCRWMTASDVLRWLDVKNPSRFDSTEAGRQISKLNGKAKRKSHGNLLSAVPPRRKMVDGEYLDDGISDHGG